MDTQHQQEAMIDDPPSSSGDETQMTDNDQTQMSENDVTPNKHAASQIFPSTQGRRHNRIASDSDHDMGESSQHIGLDPDLGNVGQSSQESDSDSDSDETEIFDKPVTKAFESRQSSHVHVPESDSESDSDSDSGADSDSGGPELGDNMSESQSSYHTQPPVKQSFNKSKASGSKSPDITESQRDKRQKYRTHKQQSLEDAFQKAQKDKRTINENQAKNKPPSPIKKRKTQKNASWVW